MAAPAQPAGVPSDRDEIPPSSPVDTDVDSPPALQDSKMPIDESSHVQNTHSSEEDVVDLLMPPPEIEHQKVVLPPIQTSGDESTTPRIFGSEIPDSEDDSELSPTINGATHEYGEALSNASPVKDTLGQLDVLNDAAPATSSIQGGFSVPPVLNDIEHTNGVNPSPDEAKSNAELGTGPVAPKTAPSNALRAEPTAEPTPENARPEASSNMKSQISVHKGNASEASGFDTTDNHELETPLPEVDVATITAHSSSLSLIQDKNGCTASKTKIDPTSNEVESGSVISHVEAVKPIKLSPEEQDWNPGQNNLSKPPSKPFKRPIDSQNKDVMMAELKAMKIASLQSRNLALQREIEEKRAKLEEVSKDLAYPAGETVKRHISLLHDYNDIRDVGQGLIGMIADNRGVRIGELYEDFGVGLKD